MFCKICWILLDFANKKLYNAILKFKGGVVCYSIIKTKPYFTKEFDGKLTLIPPLLHTFLIRCSGDYGKPFLFR